LHSEATFVTDAAPAPADRIQRTFRIRVAVFLIGVAVFLVALNALLKTVNTIHQLDAVEAERDQWQRPGEVIAALDIGAGNSVADVGAGSGYFALKLSPRAGPNGQVVAEEIRKLPLFFLWIRAALRGGHNIRVRLGVPDDPRLPEGTLDAVLIANTYHEFEHPQMILSQVARSLRAHGRLVVLDRSQDGDDLEPIRHGHTLRPEGVARQLGEAGLEIARRDDRFIVREGGEQWWLIVARKTAN
jgi:SAM-dependent methyltransferase